MRYNGVNCCTYMESNVGAHPLRYTTTRSVAVVGSAKSRSVWSSGWHSARGGSSYGKLSSGPEGELLTWEVILERKRETVLTTYQDRGLARLVLTSSSWTRTYAQISRYLHCAVLACCASGSTARAYPPKSQPSIKSEYMGGIRQRTGRGRRREIGFVVAARSQNWKSTSW